MRLKLLAGVSAVAALTALAGCSSAPQSQYGKAAGNYQGVLPCVDCAGIRTDLKITNDNDISGSFNLRSVREGKSDKVLETKGNLQVQTNAGPQSLPTVYVLKGADGNTIYNLRPLDNGDLQLLKPDQSTAQGNDAVVLKRR
ncbi:copper resistance protein NlpE N-terminal domain-containing protein [Carnimonas nigrificans]|uniref:copper resistance protein NlpE N-terminal domain-containing protein n=1 Tax=Carnimonas nigrificans TaxID=64323 RepID=UPI00046F7259|nr:copper resistance protein NlpE N-terminal domain-containing protein [Carnimonas nigrificans]